MLANVDDRWIHVPRHVLLESHRFVLIYYIGFVALEDIRAFGLLDPRGPRRQRGHRR